MMKSATNVHNKKEYLRSWSEGGEVVVGGGGWLEESRLVLPRLQVHSNFTAASRNGLP